MNIIRIVLAISLWAITSAFAFSISSGPDPYILPVGDGEANSSSLAEPGFKNINGRTLKSSVPSAPSTTAVVIVLGQSMTISASAGTYTTSSGSANNFNLYDGGIYACENPVLGAGTNVTSLGTNSVNCQIADGLISAGTYTQVIVAPIGIGNTACADWNTGGLVTRRIQVVMSRLKAASLTPGTGFAGDLWILWHNGENDNGIATPRATLAACIRSVAAIFVSNGSGTSRFFVATESILSNVASATVTGAQADAVSTGCSTCRAGSNWDSLTGGTNRQADGTHWTQTGAASAASLDVTTIRNCKNTSC